MSRYIAAVLILQCFVETLQSNTTHPANSTQLTWRDILPTDCGYKDSEFDEALEELESGNKFTNGHFATIEQHPWQVAILSNDKQDFECGGSIISKYHVLTAAHCFVMVTNATINNIKTQSTSPVSHTKRLAVVGSSRYAESDMVYTIKELYMHKLYSYNRRRNDIALLKIDGEFVWSIFLYPICLPVEDEEYTPGRICHVSGFGYVKKGTSNKLGILRSGSVSLSPENDCKETKREQQGTVTEGMFCASEYTKGDVSYDTCQDDSGGPLQCDSINGSSVLLGITSVGKGCGLKNYPGVYTKVSKYLQWIHDRVEGRDKDETQTENGRTTQRPAKSEFPSNCDDMKPGTSLNKDNKAHFKIEKTPWLVLLILLQSKNYTYGAIISKKYVLAAAHDIYTPSNTPTLDALPVQFIYAGDASMKTAKRKYDLSRIICHPDYNSSTSSNDIALIEIKGEFNFSAKIWPICMPYDELYQIHSQVMFARFLKGIGNSYHKLLDNGDCSRKIVGYELSTNLSCSMGIAADVTAVPGPLFANRRGRHFLLGVFSWRPNGTVHDNHPRIFTKVLNFMEWIREVTTGV